MKKGKRLLVVLLATLVLALSAVSVAFAAVDHDFNGFSGENATMTVLCNGQGHSGTSPAHGSITINKPANNATDKIVYDGKTHAATITGNAYNVSDISGSGTYLLYYDTSTTPVVSVYAGSLTVSDITYEGTTLGGDDYESTTAPKAAGTYTAKVTLSGKTAEDGDVTPAVISTQFTIVPKEVSVEWSHGSTLGTDYKHVYDGQEHVPSVRIKNGKVTGDYLDITVKGAAKNAGEYNATAELTGRDRFNYVIKEDTAQTGTSTATQKFEITKAQLTVGWGPTNFTYNGSNQKPTAEVTSGLVGGDSCDLEVDVYSAPTEGTKLTAYKNAHDDEDAVIKYYAQAKPVNTNYEANYSLDGNKRLEYTIAQKPAELRWLKTDLTYNGKNQLPTAELSNLCSGDSCEVTVGIKPAETANYKDVGRYTAQAIALKNKNYVLQTQEDKFTTPYNINPKTVNITWYRNNNDAYGIPTSGTTDAVDGADFNLVYTGHKVAPMAKVNVADLETGDTCTVAVEAPDNAIVAGRYTAKAVGLSNKNYQLSANKSIEYNIVKRPVTINWGTLETTYNGQKQDKVPTLGNLGDDGRGHVDVVTAGATTYVGKHFGTGGNDEDENATSSNNAGTAIEESRLATDASKYSITAGELSNPYDYTYFKLNPTDNTEAQTYVDYYNTENYTIHQYKIKTIDWSKTTTTYNASYQIPTAVVADKQGPDTDEQVKLVLEDQEMQYRENNYKGEVNAGNYKVYIGVYQTGKIGERAMNYLIDGTKARKTDSSTTPEDGYGVHSFVINKRPLQVIANPKTIWYKDAPNNAGVTYKGLINGDPNKTDDLGGGKPGYYYKGDTKTDVILGTPKFTYSYAKNGKPGTYKIYVSGITSDNYDIQPVAGTLTVLDRYDYLNAKGTKSGKKGILVSWNGITGAASYDVYMSLCNTKKKVYTPVYVGSTSGTSLKVTKIGKKKLKAKKAYKYYVVAKNASGAAIAQSDMGHFITNNVKGKKVNAKSMAVNTHSVSIAKGGTAGLSASYTKAKKGKKYKLLDAWHSPLTRYATENPAVATVDANGTVYGVGKGWTRVYVYGVSGMWETVEVYVQ